MSGFPRALLISWPQDKPIRCYRSAMTRRHHPTRSTDCPTNAAPYTQNPIKTLSSHGFLRRFQCHQSRSWAARGSPVGSKSPQGERLIRQGLGQIIVLVRRGFRIIADIYPQQEIPQYFGIDLGIGSPLLVELSCQIEARAGGTLCHPSIQ
jgi:hypothetical protein